MAQPAPPQPQTHTHGPGQPAHSHSHGPPQAQPQGPQLMLPPPDPIMQAIIEADYKPVNLTLGGQSESIALCGPHKLEKCSDCNLDCTQLNRLSKLLLSNPNLRCPPPPNVLSQKLSIAINNTKEEGNTLFKAGQPEKAIQRYTMAANIAVQRPMWEHSQILREELSTLISNRSAAFLECGDYIGALCDAETVISLKRNWSKGHFRKAKALMDMGELQEAKEAIGLGLQYEPNNAEMNNFLTDIDSAIKKVEEIQAAAKAAKKATLS